MNEQSRYSPELAEQEASVVSEIAKKESEDDLTEKPSSANYNYASHFVDGLRAGWGYEINNGTGEKALAVYDAARPFENSGQEAFFKIAESSATNLIFKATDLGGFLDQLIKEENVTLENKKRAFEAYVDAVYAEQAKYIKEKCLEDPILGKDPSRLDQLIEEFLVLRPIIPIPRRHHEFLKTLYLNQSGEL
jgi:hypothetical protein